tara:strand:- start:9347 stop:9916 length:570 start_codon:yes stop_codon:yes gene_type:complete
MAEDLAIDVGIPKNSSEFQTFVSCIENILEYGCGYGDDFTEDVLEKCRKSDLEIAKKVIEELEKPRSRYRQTKLKWWKKYTPKRERKQPSSPRRRQHKRRPNNNQRRQPQRQRPMSPMFRRPMSPMFRRSPQQRRPPPAPKKRRKRQREEIEYERQPEQSHRRRYTIREDRRPSDVPEWPSKNKRYRKN